MDPMTYRALSFALQRLFVRIGVLPFLLVIALIVFTSLSTRFLTSENLITVARQATYLAIVSMGQMLALLTGGFDLSVGKIVAITSVITALTMAPLATAHPDATAITLTLGILAGIGAGTLVGVVNGIGVAVFSVSPFMMTLGTATISFGIALTLTSGVPVYGIPDAFGTIFSFARIFDIPSPVYVTAGLFVAMYILLNWTRMGRYFYAVGGNLKASRLSGINTRFYLFMAYVLSGGLAAMAGALELADSSQFLLGCRGKPALETAHLLADAGGRLGSLRLGDVGRGLRGRSSKRRRRGLLDLPRSLSAPFCHLEPLSRQSRDGAPLRTRRAQAVPKHTAAKRSVNPSGFGGQEIGRQQPSQQTFPGRKRPDEVDAYERRLPNRQFGDARQLRRERAEVRVVAHQNRPARVPGSAKEPLDRLYIDRSAKRIDHHNVYAERGRDQLCRLDGPDLRRGKDRVRLEARLRKEESQAFRLKPPLFGQRPGVFLARPFHRVAGMRVTNQAELRFERRVHAAIISRATVGARVIGPFDQSDYALRSSTSPVARKTTSSAMLVTLSPMRSRSLAAKSRWAPTSTQEGSTRIRSSERSK